MERDAFVFKDAYGQAIHNNKWFGSIRPKGAIQIIHGMAEHSARYADFAEYLVNKGFVVYASDLRGHGLTARTIENTGFFATGKGWDIVIENIYQLSEIIKKEYPDIPLYLFGHSMGSLLARGYIARYPSMADGAILSGTSYNPAVLLWLGKVVANIQRIFAGKRHRSRLLDTLSFGKFNSSFKPAITKFDWLSRDEKQVELYLKDPYCGFICTASFYSDLFSGILKIQKRKSFSAENKNLPILIISGEMDAVGDFTKGVKKIFTLYKEGTMKDVEIKIYKESRHEILNETNREEVYFDVSSWLSNKIEKLINSSK